MKLFSLEMNLSTHVHFIQSNGLLLLLKLVRALIHFIG